MIRLRSLQCFAHLRELLSQRGGRKAPREAIGKHGPWGGTMGNHGEPWGVTGGVGFSKNHYFSQKMSLIRIFSEIGLKGNN